MPGLIVASDRLTDCRDCGTEVSVKAKSCPHCGASRPARKGAEETLHQLSVGAFKVGCGLMLLPFALLLLAVSLAALWAIIDSGV